MIQHSLHIQLCVVKLLCELAPGKNHWAGGEMVIEPGISMSTNLLQTHSPIREHLGAQD